MFTIVMKSLQLIEFKHTYIDLAPYCYLLRYRIIHIISTVEPIFNKHFGPEGNLYLISTLGPADFDVCILLRISKLSSFRGEIVEAPL